MDKKELICSLEECLQVAKGLAIKYGINEPEVQAQLAIALFNKIN